MVLSSHYQHEQFWGHGRPHMFYHGPRTASSKRQPKRTNIGLAVLEWLPKASKTSIACTKARRFPLELAIHHMSLGILIAAVASAKIVMRLFGGFSILYDPDMIPTPPPTSLLAVPSGSLQRKLLMLEVSMTLPSFRGQSSLFSRFCKCRHCETLVSSTLIKGAISHVPGGISTVRKALPLP